MEVTALLLFVLDFLRCPVYLYTLAEDDRWRGDVIVNLYLLHLSLEYICRIPALALWKLNPSLAIVDLYLEMQLCARNPR